MNQLWSIIKLQFWIGIVAISFACEPSEKITLEMDFDTAISELKSSGQDEFQAHEAGIPYVRHRNLDVTWNSQDKDIITLPEFSFVNQNEEIIDRSSIEGKIVLVNFFYMHCAGMCPIIMKRMENIHNQIKDYPDVVILSHSLMPEIDTPDALKNFGETFGSKGKNWHLLTGNEEEIYKLARDTYHADTTRGQKIEKNFRHSEHIYLIDAEGAVRGLYNGKNPSAVKQALKDLQNLRSQAHAVVD